MRRHVPEVILKEIKAQLHKVRGLSEAFLFRKVVDSERVYVLAVLAGYTWQEGVSAKHLDPLFEDLVQITGLPTPIVFISLDIQFGELLPKIKAVSGAEIYIRE